MNVTERIRGLLICSCVVTARALRRSDPSSVPVAHQSSRHALKHVYGFLLLGRSDYTSTNILRRAQPKILRLRIICPDSDGQLSCHTRLAPVCSLSFLHALAVEHLYMLESTSATALARQKQDEYLRRLCTSELRPIERVHYYQYVYREPSPRPLTFVA